MAQHTVTDVMTPDVIGLPASASVAEAAELMRDNNIGDVLVLDDGRVKGMITDRDLTIRVLAEHREPANTTVADVCSTDVVSVSPDAPVTEAVSLMRDRAVRRLPVISSDGQAQGMVSIGDLAMTEDPTSALADISAAPPNE